MTNTRIKREVAWRIFAGEFNSATLELPGEDQYAPTYVLSPLGALINRVYITGVLTECENVGTDQEPLWRGRVSDPTGVFFVSAGQFQPKAAQAMADLEPPALVGLVGKARTYSPDDMTTYVSVRIELIKIITQDIRDHWVLEACRNLSYRLGCIQDAQKMDSPEIEKLIAQGYNKNISKGVIEAIDQFDAIDLQQYGNILSNTLKELSMGTSMDSTTIGAGDSNLGGATAMRTDDVDESTKKKKADTEPDDQARSEVSEQLIFEIIIGLAEDNSDGVVYDDVKAKAIEQGLEKAVIEECIWSLIDKGAIYEPTIGIFKAV